jgi:nicotinamide mononucleotide transporter
MEIFRAILEEAAALSWVDWVVSATAILYVVMAARGLAWGWAWGMLSCSLWAYASYTFYDLYLDALLQIFYVVVAGIGLYQWKYGAPGQAPLPISRLPWRSHLYIILIGTVLSLVFGYFFSAYTPAAATYWDAFTTVFSVAATLLLVRKVLENWAYWVVIDLLYAGLYASRGAWLFALLMAIYVLIAAAAYRTWQGRYRAEGQVKKGFLEGH